MPEELTSSPGYVPFTLGPEAQEWVDAMAEVVDGGKAVYGRPKPVGPVQHRSLATSPPTPPPTMPTSKPPPTTGRGTAPRTDAARLATTPPRQPLETSQPIHRVIMPDIGGPEANPPRSSPPPLRTVPRRVLMPEIAESAETPEEQKPLMPAIGENDETLGQERSLMPEIGE